ncbi:MAG: hypothetical protein AAF549_07415, partial [Pseudomonadota bacterium]
MKHNSQSGNVIILIFVAVGLFGALAFAFNQSSRTSAAFITDTQVNNFSDRLISYGNEVKNAVKRLELRGCLPSEISFENFTQEGYENPVSPITQKCHIFETEGGGLTWQNVEKQISEEGWVFTGFNQVLGIGTDDENIGDLVMALPGIRTEICNAVNKKLDRDFEFPPEDEGTWDETQFTGTYNDQELIGSAPNFENILSGCFQDDQDRNVFYATLIRQ